METSEVELRFIVVKGAGWESDTIRYIRFGQGYFGGKLPYLPYLTLPRC